MYIIVITNKIISAIEPITLVGRYRGLLLARSRNELISGRWKVSDVYEVRQEQ